MKPGETFIAKSLTGLITNNTKHLGKFIGLPKACCSDGHLDVMEMSAGRFGQNLHNLSTLSRLQFYNPVELRPVTQMSVELDEPRDLMVDGELFSSVVAVKLAIRPGAAEFI